MHELFHHGGGRDGSLLTIVDPNSMILLYYGYLMSVFINIFVFIFGMFYQ